MHYHHRNPKALLTPAMHGVLERMARAGHMPLHALDPGTSARSLRQLVR
jgi:acetyl esterase